MESLLLPSKQQLSSAFTAIKGLSLPTIPEIVLKLDQEISSVSPDVDKIVALITHDVALSSQILKTINSPAYGMARKIDSIQQATMLLGLKNIKNLVVAGAIQKALRAEMPPILRVLWDNSAAIALTASMLSHHVHGLAKDEAYMAGLFQNSGSLMLAKKWPDYEQIHAMTKRDPVAATAEEQRRYGADHAMISYLLSEHWRVTETVAAAILHHHTPMDMLPDSNPKFRGLVATLKLARAVVNIVLYPESGGDQEPSVDTCMAMDELAIAHESFADLHHDIEDVILTI